MFTASLLSNISHSTVPYAFVAAGLCLLSSCLAVDFYSGFIIPVLGHHVTIYIIKTQTPQEEGSASKDKE
jgi:hypothetical protein